MGILAIQARYFLFWVTMVCSVAVLGQTAYACHKRGLCDGRVITVLILSSASALLSGLSFVLGFANAEYGLQWEWLNAATSFAMNVVSVALASEHGTDRTLTWVFAASGWTGCITAAVAMFLSLVGEDGPWKLKLQPEEARRRRMTLSTEAVPEERYMRVVGKDVCEHIIEPAQPMRALEEQRS